MGTPVVEPPEYAADCPACTPALFATGETPRFVTLTTSGIVACPGAPHPAPNGTWILEQLVPLPCAWVLSTPEYDFAWQTWAGFTRTACLIFTGASYYFHYDQAPPCQIAFANERVDCVPANTWGHSGTALITW